MKSSRLLETLALIHSRRKKVRADLQSFPMRLKQIAFFILIIVSILIALIAILGPSMYT